MRWNKRIYIRDLHDKIDETHTISGWIQFTRKGKVKFLGIRDGSGIIQGVMVKGETEETSFALFPQLKQETCVTVTGVVQQAQRSQWGVELLVQKIEILSPSANFPITPKEHGVDFLLSKRHLWHRSRRQVAIFKIRNTVIRALRDFFYKYHFIQMDSPIFTQVIGEDVNGLFSVDYFGLGKAFLAQTGQLYLEASIFAHGNVFCFGPTFRNEKSKTRRHLTEFWMLEAEMAFFDNDDNMDLQEDMILFVLERVIEHNTFHLQQLERDPETLRQCLAPFKRLDYGEAIEILQKRGRTIQFGDDLGATDETVLSEDYKTPVFVYDYPKKVKAFYMKESATDPERVKCADLIAPEGYGEIIGGSQREEHLDKLAARIKEENLPMDTYNWYLDLRKYGTVVHSGFGLGLERLVGWICGIKHVRETIPFPRLMERMTP